MSEPVAYAAVAADGSESVYVTRLKEQAEACCRENGGFLLPLYAAPPTWQEEVAAVEDAFERSGVKPTWPDDEPANIGPMAAAMADEIERLRAAIRPELYEKSDEKRVLCDTKSPRNSALSGCETVPDPDSRVWETPCTPQPHATPPQGSVQGEGRFRVSQNANEPVAWHINGSEYDTGCEYEYATLERGIAEAATAEGCVVVPLYRHQQPTLTDEEREAVEWCRDNITAMAHPSSAFACVHAATLRGLLERLS